MNAVQIITGVVGLACLVLAVGFPWVRPAGAPRTAWMGTFIVVAVPLLAVSTAIGVWP